VRPFNKPASALRRWRSAAWFVGVVASLAPACSGGAPADDSAAAEVPTITAEVGKVTRQDLSRVLTLRGTIATRPNRDVKISALVAGRVTAVRVAEGDTVGEGQIVAEIDPRPLEDQQRHARAAVAQANAAIENAKANLDRTQRLLERGIASGKELEDARTQYAAAQAAVEQSQAALSTVDLQLSRTKVASPISGQVARRMVSVGEQVDGTAGQPIVEVADLDVVELAANLPSEQLLQVSVGAAVTIVPDAYGGRTFPGTVIAIAPAIDATTNAALTRIRVVNSGRLLKVGMFAEARVIVENRRGALVVPPAAIVRDESGEASVYVVKGDTAERTAVKVGLETPEATEVVSGVSEGQTVLTSAVHGLGDKVRLGRKS
jgi:RND family efflux transporter MFP subunit